MTYFSSIFAFFVFSLLLFFGSFAYAATASDIAGYQYQESIQYLYDYDVVEGYTDGTFGPDREINRAEIMKIILKSNLGEAVGGGVSCFPDVTDQWYARYICYAKNHAIVKGYDDGRFKPTQTVIFAEALKMALETYGVDLDAPKSGDKWYQIYLDFVHDNNIFSKYAYLPTKNITRGEMSFLIHKLMLNKAG